MLKLRYLFDNPELTHMLLKHWHYDAEESKDLLTEYRISSNAVYPYLTNNEVRLLRFTPAEEKDKTAIMAELEYIRYLKSAGYPALETIPSKEGQELVEASTPWGTYYAVAFKRVSGQPLSACSFTPELSQLYGQHLGKLHKLSADYQPIQYRRSAHDELFNWIRVQLKAYNAHPSALVELDQLKDAFSHLPKTSRTYGLIHYDFEFDNVFYDVDQHQISVIDFDDMMYHFYGMDIFIALTNIDEEVHEPTDALKDAFIKGYKHYYEFDEAIYAHFPLFERFDNLYTYTRILRSSNEYWENEPLWLQNCRQRLQDYCKQAINNFSLNDN